MIEQTPPATPSPADVQGRRPTVGLGLSRVGVTGLERVVRLHAQGSEQLFYSELECFVDLGGAQKGVHMSRFEETVNEAVDEVVLEESLKVETLAAHIAERVRDRQGGVRAEATIAARYPELKRTPSSERTTQEIYTLLGGAVASEYGTRRLIGVQAQGMTACPCAQEMLSSRSRERLSAGGFTEGEIARILEQVPVATHNQRGLGTLHVGRPEGCDEPVEARELLGIVESSMSSEVYELLKRSDEAEVVESAHRRPRFVEDCVRHMISMAVEEFGRLGEQAFVMARQENLETIHRHSAVAERYGHVGDLARELGSPDYVAPHVTMREWLEGARAQQG